MNLRRVKRRRIDARSLAVTAMLAVTAVGCANHSLRGANGFAAQQDADEATLAPMSIAKPAGTSYGRPSMELSSESDDIRLASDTPSQPGAGRIVIYTATFRMVVVEIESSIKEAEKIAVDCKGWVQSVSGDTISIRVPADQYEAAVAKVESMGRVTDRQLQASDVTEEYVDLEARLKNAMAVRDRLNALLAKAEDVKAALEVERELGRIGEEIERLQGKLKLLNNRVSFSTITVSFERVYRSTPAPHVARLPFEWLNELNPNRLLLNR